LAISSPTRVAPTNAAIKPAARSRRAAVQVVDEQTQELQFISTLLGQRHITPLPYP
jgi:hypothetical protein